MYDIDVWDVERRTTGLQRMRGYGFCAEGNNESMCICTLRIVYRYVKAKLQAQISRTLPSPETAVLRQGGHPLFNEPTLAWGAMVKRQRHMCLARRCREYAE